MALVKATIKGGIKAAFTAVWIRRTTNGGRPG